MAKRGNFTYDFPRPAVTVDVALFCIRDETLHVGLIQRAGEPFRGRWALPGGFVDPEEPLEKAARRELSEETGIDAAHLRPVGVFGDPGRDPRGWTVSAAYYALLGAGTVELRPGDDASEAGWKQADRLPPLAFDHRRILTEAFSTLRRDLYVLPVVAPLLPRESALRQIASVYRALDPDCPATRILKRRLMDAGLIRSTGSNRPARYRFRSGQG